MKNHPLDAPNFEYTISYFDAKFEQILSRIIICYNCIISEKIKVPLNNENAIRDIMLNNYLKNTKFKTLNKPLSNYHFDKETSESGGRADIRVLKVNPYEDDDAYYVIECKRLNGKKDLNSKYVVSGIARFTNEKKYHFFNNSAGMLGFVVEKIDINQNILAINEFLSKEEELFGKTIVSDFKYSYCSKHNINGISKTIYHLMLDFSENIAI